MKNIKVVLLAGAIYVAAPQHFAAAQIVPNPSTPTREVPKSEQLTNAINKGDLAAVQALVEADPKLVTTPTSRYGNQGPLSVAATSGKIEIVKYLLDKGADPNQEYSGTSILSNLIGGYSSRENWKEVAELLVAKGADVNRVDTEGNVPLLRALSYGSSDNRRQKVEWLLANKADVTLKNRSGQSAVEYAILNSSSGLETLKLLMEKVNIKNRDIDGNSYLHLAASRNNAEVVRFLIEKGVDVNAQNGRGDTVLHLIAPNPGTLLKILLDAGANPNLRNARGDLPLHVALRRLESVRPDTTYYGSSVVSSPQGYAVDRDTSTPRGTIIAPLVEKSDITVKDQYGMSPLLLAISARDQESRDLIMEKAPKMDATTQLFDAAASGNAAVLTPLLAQKPFLVYFRLPDGSTPLHISALWGTSGVATALLAKGADPNARDSNARTPLHRAITRPSGLFLRRSKNMASLLLSKKADPSLVDQNGASPLHRAVQSGEVELVTALLDSKAQVNIRDESGMTPLMMAITKTAPIAITNLLLANGAEVNVRNRSFSTPLSLAVGTRRLDLVQALLAKGADVTYKGSEGRGLLAQLVERYGDSGTEDSTKEIFTLLLAKGADPNDRIYSTSIASTLISNGSENSKELLKILLATKKVPLVGNYNGERSSLLMQAVNYGRKGMIEMLIDAGADVNEKDAQGRSLIQIANNRGSDKSIVEILKAKGATE